MVFRNQPNKLKELEIQTYQSLLTMGSYPYPYGSYTSLWADCSMITAGLASIRLFTHRVYGFARQVFPAFWPLAPLPFVADRCIYGRHGLPSTLRRYGFSKP